MVIRFNSLLVDPVRTNSLPPPPDRERERLRRELLRRIIDREARRQALRSVPH